MAENVPAVKYSNSTSLAEAVEEGLMVLKLLGSQEFYECRLCSKVMSGNIPAQSHLQGASHMKMLRNYLSTAKFRHLNTLPSAAIDSTTSPVFTSGNDPETSLEQNISDMSLTSFGRSEKDRIESAMKKGLVTVNVVSPLRILTCNLCYITCNGDIPMNQHLSGESHMKKQRKMDIPDSTIPLENSLKVDSFSSSNPSHVVLPTPFIPVKTQDLLNADDDIVNSAIKEGIVKRTVVSDINHLTCEICHSSCTGQTPMKQHLLGNGHQKKIKARRSLESSRQSSIIPPRSLYRTDKNLVLSSPMQNSNDEAKGVLNSAKDKGYIIETGEGFECLICNISCTGRAPATDHLNGEAHHKKLRDQIECQLHLLKTPPVKDSTNPFSASPPRDGMSSETRLSSDTAVVTTSDLQKSVSQPDNSFTVNGRCQSNPSSNGIQIYNTSKSIDKIF